MCVYVCVCVCVCYQLYTYINKEDIERMQESISNILYISPSLLLH